MAQRTHGLHALLAHSRFYDLIQELLGAKRSRRRFVEEVIRPVDGQRVLDIGCGTAAILDFLPAVDYLGIDLSPEYVKSARKRLRNRGDVRIGTAGDLDAADIGRFDIIMALGVLHHLDDDKVRALFQSATELLSSSGRLITIDPTYSDNQHPIARLLVKCDRGLNVRTEPQLASLARGYFDNVITTVRTDLLRIPYSHIILECIPDRVN